MTGRLLLALAAPVLQFHGDAQRNGLYLGAAFAPQLVGSFHRDTVFDGRVQGHVYAQPLFLPGRGGRDLILVATESDVVQGLDATTGATVWKRQVGAPVPLRDLPCGDIDPLGITGTPVASETGDTVYLDAMVTPDGGKTKRHMLFALSTDDGAIKPGWPLDVGAALAAQGLPFQAAAQNQRSALGLEGGALVVVYGGHYGDCGDFRGIVLRVPVDAPAHLQAWEIPVRGGGIWAPGGPLMAEMPAGSFFVSTGNTFGAAEFSFGESVLRFPIEGPLRPTGWFAPSNWKELDERDADLGGMGPVGSRDGEHGLVVAAFGKDGNVYLLDGGHLGHLGGELAKLRAVRNAGGMRGAAALFHDERGFVFVVNGRGAACPKGESGDLTAIRASWKPAGRRTPALAIEWCADSHGRAPPGGSPIVTSPDGRSGFVVWNVGAEGDDRLHAFDGETGKALYESEPMPLVRRFQTPLAANGRLYVAADGRIYAFVPAAAAR